MLFVFGEKGRVIEKEMDKERGRERKREREPRVAGGAERWEGSERSLEKENIRKMHGIKNLRKRERNVQAGLGHGHELTQMLRVLAQIPFPGPISGHSTTCERSFQGSDNIF